MALFTVDEEKCQRDGICAAECPRMIIELKDGTSVPTPVEGADEACIHCGHCVAVCPHGAFSLRDMSPRDCPPVEKDKVLTPQAVEHVLRSRRSIRKYGDREVDRGILEDLISVARYAPTGMNRQEVEWLAVNSRTGVRKLAGMTIDWMRFLVRTNEPAASGYNMPAIVEAWDKGTDFICRNAPAIVITHAPKEFGSAPTDCIIALTFFDIAAPSFGLGTCWAGFFMAGLANWPPLLRELALPEGNAPFGAMMAGFPKFRYQRLPLRSEARISWRG